MTEETILIIDDDSADRLVLKNILQKRGYTLLAAESGEKGIRIARTEPVDLILLDLAMPGMDGFAVCDVLKEDPDTGEIPILLLSSGAEVRKTVKGLRAGGADFIMKPFDRGEVLARVQAHLKIRRLGMELTESQAALLEKKARMEEDLRAAEEIQRSLLPVEAPAMPGIRAAWSFQEACGRGGGDLFNMFPLPGERFGFYMLDVSGQGVSAALVGVSVARALQPSSGIVIRGEGASEAVPPQEVVSALGEQFPMERFDKFFTIFYGVLDMKEGTLSYSSAGHQPAFLVRADGNVELLDKGGTIIGLGGVLPFEGDTLTVQPGEKLVLYTDGLVEYEREDGEMLGQHRLQNMVLDHRQKECRDFLSFISRDVSAFGKGAALKDDQSLLVFEFTGAEPT